MNRGECPQEEAVTKAARTGNCETSLATHAAGCQICREILKTSSWMQALARSCERNRPLPDASLLWRSVQISEQQTKAERSQDLLEWIAFGSVAVPLLGLTAWLGWNWYEIQGRIAWIMAGAQIRMTAYSLPTIFSPIVAVLCLVALVLVYPMLVDE